MIGNLLVVFSQMFTALQMCLEERFVKGYNMPALLAVGWEGVWGILGVSALLVGLQHTQGGGGFPVEDTAFAWQQLMSSPEVGLFMLSNAVSIAFYNYFGMVIAKNSSASYRMILDSLRIVAVWVVDLATGGGHFFPLQLLGFALMAAGTAVYNEAVALPCLAYPSAADREEQAQQREADQQRAQALLPAGHEPSPSPPPPFGAPLSQPQPDPLTVQDFFTPNLTRFTLQKS